MATLRITQIKSSVSRPADQGRTLRALGLKKIRQTVEHPDRPEIRGMVNKVIHLVSVEEVKDRAQKGAEG